MSAVHRQRRVCPLVTEPQPDCFCTSLTSQKIIEVVAYCCDRFEDCAIYRRQHQGAAPGQVAASGAITVKAKGVES